MKVIRFLISILIVISFGLLFIVVVAQIPQVRDIAVSRILDEANRLLNGKIQVGAIGGDLLSGLDLTGVQVVYQGETVLQANQVVARWNILSLFARRIELTGVWMNGIELTLSENRDGEWKITKALSLKKPSAEESALTIVVSRLEIRNARAQMITDTEVRRVSIDQLRASLYSGPQNLAVNLQEARGIVSDPSLTINGASGHFEMSKTPPRRLQWGDIQIQLRASTLRSRGTVGLSEDEGASLIVQADSMSPLDLKALGSPIAIPFAVQAEIRGPWNQLLWSFSTDSTAGIVRMRGTANLPFTSPTAPDWKKFSLEATGSVADIVPAKWLGTSAERKTRISTKFTVKGERMGAPDRAVSVAFDGRKSIVGGVRVRSFDGSINYLENRFRGKASLVSARTTVKVSGRVNLHSKSYAGRIAVRNLHPEDWVGAAWAGKINLSVRMKGVGVDPDSLSADGLIRVTDSRMGTYGIRRITLPLFVARGMVRVNQAVIDTTVLDARLHGRLPVRKGKEGKMNLLARVDDLSLLYPGAATQGVAGRAMAHVKVSGSLEKMTMVATLRGSGLHRGQTLIPDLDLDIEGRGLNVMTKEGSLEALARLTTPVYGEFQFGEVVAAFSIDRTGKELDGTFFLSAVRDGVENRLRGRYEIETPRLKLVLEDFVVSTNGSRWLSQGEAVIDVQRDGFVVRNFDLRNGQQQVLIDGSLSPAGTQNLRIRLNRVQLGPLGPMLGRGDTFGGQLDGSVWLTGTLSSPVIESTVALADGTFGEYRVKLATLVLLYQDRWLSAELRMMQSQAAGLILGDAKIPVNLGRLAPGQSRIDHRKITGRIVSEDVSLQLVAAATDQIEGARGTVNMHIKLGGTLRGPLFNGELTLAGGGFRVRATNVVYSNLSLRAVLRNREITLHTLHVRSGKRGQLNGSGTVMLPAPGDSGYYGIRLVAENLLLVENERATASADADLTLTGTPKNPVLTGTVSPRRVIISPPPKSDKRLEPLVFDYPGIHVIEEGGVQAALIPTDRATQIELSPLTRAQINVVVYIERNVWIRNQDTNVELSGLVSAFKDPGEEKMRFVGEIQLVRGFYRLQGKRLDIQEGRIAFTGTNELNPVLDISLTYEVPDYLVTAHVTGTLRKPILDLSSQPALEEADILAVILFGRPFDNLGQGEQVAMRERVGQLLGGFAAEELRRQLGGELGIDTLDISPSGEGADEAGGPTVGVGKYLSEDVFVQYLQRFGSEAGSEVRLEYYFTKHWLVQSSASTGGQSGLDVFWHVTF